MSSSSGSALRGRIEELESGWFRSGNEEEKLDSEQRKLKAGYSVSISHHPVKVNWEAFGVGFLKIQSH
jgi:hypothetical protein